MTRPARRPRTRSARAACAAAALAGLAGLAACESKAERERRYAAEDEAMMLGMAEGDAREETTFQRDSAALAASLAVDTVAGAETRTRVVRYEDPDDGALRTALDTVFAVRGRRLGYCDDVTAEVAARAPGDTLTCQWRPALDTAAVVVPGALPGAP